MWKKFVAPTLLVILFWGASSVATAYYIRWLEAVPERMIMEDLSTIHAQDAMRFKLGQLLRTIVNAERPVKPQVAAEIAGYEKEFRSHLADAFKSATSEKERAIDRQIEARFQAFTNEADRQLKQARAATTDPSEDIRRLMHITGEISALGVQLGEMNEQLMKDLATSRSPSTQTLTMIRYGLLVAGPIFGILGGFYISRRFHRSISQISITLNDVATEMRERVGRVDVRESGDLPRLEEQVNRVVGRIRGVMLELDEARKQAVTSERLAALGEMAAGVAHELRNPLTSVKLLIQSSVQRPQRALTDKQHEVVLEEIARMETTIERMLDFARPPRINRRRHDVRDIIARTVSIMEDRARHAKVEIASNFSPDPVHVNVDAEQLHQVFANLLQNAVEAMPAGGNVRVSIEPRTTEQTCRITFADSGNGISAEVMKRIFEPFVTDKARGTGLGLAVSHRIVTEHDGLLLAKNDAAGGAIFTVELPLMNAPASSSSIPSDSPRSNGPMIRAERENAQIAHH